MTREDQIIKESIKYGNLPEFSDGDLDYRDIALAFRNGALWSDNNLLHSSQWITSTRPIEEAIYELRDINLLQHKLSIAVKALKRCIKSTAAYNHAEEALKELGEK